jgi:hypothetical protein
MDRVACSQGQFLHMSWRPQWRSCDKAKSQKFPVKEPPHLCLSGAPVDRVAYFTYLSETPINKVS